MITDTEPQYLDLDGMLAIGITRRQVDYWATKGYLRPVKASPGTGTRRRWPVAEREVARLMARFVRAGLAVDVAAATARVAIEHDLPEVTIADGITITLRKSA